ncbi:hypothetical protein HGH92_29780 [Chitinophaga varians]|uniref:Uncharacterized protein n=1 Tax=Chitinophaga varians TaxID=2202339 RepID=A0A847RZJ5_9BACT|nr:hypothetical protein [Chitinophaga varians]NLR68532.1 hypothetical protein [Chitinophaga varians]
MAEIVKYKGRPVTIGNYENLYYATFEKFVAALASGFLQQQPGSLMPFEYAKPDLGFSFRFPFPDEDHFPIGERFAEYAKGISIVVSESSVYPEKDFDPARKLNLLICQQEVHLVGSDVVLTTALHDHEHTMAHQTGRRDPMMEVVKDIINNHIVNNPDTENRVFYRQLVGRILKGYRPFKLSDLPNIITYRQDTMENRKRPIKRRL